MKYLATSHPKSKPNFAPPPRSVRESFARDMAATEFGATYPHPDSDGFHDRVPNSSWRRLGGLVSPQVRRAASLMQAREGARR